MKSSFELNVEKKLFSSTQYLADQPINACIGLDDTAQFGALPKINRNAIEKAIELGIFLKCNIAKTLLFERKLSLDPCCIKGYLLSQKQKPLLKNGIFFTSEKKMIEFEFLCLEEKQGVIENSILNLNESGRALIVYKTKPSFHSFREIALFFDDFTKALKERALIHPSFSQKNNLFSFFFKQKEHPEREKMIKNVYVNDLVNHETSHLESLLLNSASANEEIYLTEPDLPEIKNTLL